MVPCLLVPSSWQLYWFWASELQAAVLCSFVPCLVIYILFGLAISSAVVLAAAPYAGSSGHPQLSRHYPSIPSCWTFTARALLCPVFVNKPLYFVILRLGLSCQCLTERTGHSGPSRMSLRILPPATAQERGARLKALRDLRQQGLEVRAFAQFFWTMSRGLEYQEPALKEVFNLALDDPLPQWEIEQLKILDFWDFANYVHHRKDWQILNPPEDVSRDVPALFPSSSLVHDHLLTPTEKREKNEGGQSCCICH